MGPTAMCSAKQCSNPFLFFPRRINEIADHSSAPNLFPWFPPRRVWALKGVSTSRADTWLSLVYFCALKATYDTSVTFKVIDGFPGAPTFSFLLLCLSPLCCWREPTCSSQRPFFPFCSSPPSQTPCAMAGSLGTDSKPIPAVGPSADVYMKTLRLPSRWSIVAFLCSSS